MALDKVLAASAFSNRQRPTVRPSAGVMQNHLQSLARPQQPRHRAESFLLPPSLCQDPTEARIQVASGRTKEECPGAGEVPICYPVLSASLCRPVLQGCSPGFLPQDWGGKSSGLWPPIQHLLCPIQKLSIDTSPSEEASPRPAFGVNIGVDFMSGGEALSARPLGFQE